MIAKDENNHDRLSTILYNLLECIRIATVLLKAFIPETADKIFHQINTQNTAYDSISNFGGYESYNKVNKAEVLFQRIETK